MLSEQVKKPRRFFQWWKEWIYPKDGEVPPPFRKKAWSVWGAIFGIAFITMCCLYVYDHRPVVEDPVGILMINVEILVTALAVTLSATLLGIQFRAQSYTMLFLMRQINNLVVYLFVGIFVSLMVISLALVVWIPKSDLDIYIPFVFLGTTFSMFYLVGYVYHMIHRLQPHEIMDEVGRDIYGILEELHKCVKQDGSLDLSISKDLNLDRWNRNMQERISQGKRPKYEKFDVWSQIMLRAIETGNVPLFERGLGKILEIYDEAMKFIFDRWGTRIAELNELMKIDVKTTLDQELQRNGVTELEEKIKQLAPTSHFFVTYIRDVMIASIESNRDLCVLSFMRAFEERDDVYLRKYGWHFGLGMMFDVWYDVMQRCVIEGKDHMIQQGINHFQRGLERRLGACKEDYEKIINRGIFHHVAASLIPLAIKKNSSYQEEYLGFVGGCQFPTDYELSICEEKPYLYPLSPWREPEYELQLFELIKHRIEHPEGWRDIVKYAYAKRDFQLFSEGIDTAFVVQMNSKYYKKMIRESFRKIKDVKETDASNMEKDPGFVKLLEELEVIIDDVEESKYIHHIIFILSWMYPDSNIDKLWMYSVSKIIVSKNPDLKNIRSDLKHILETSEKRSASTNYTELRKDCQSIFQEIPNLSTRNIRRHHLERIEKYFPSEDDE